MQILKTYTKGVVFGKRLCFLTTIIFTSLFSNLTGQTVLEPGDLAIIGVATNVGIAANDCVLGPGSGRDRVSFICFKDIEPGTEIDFTDNGWQRQVVNFWGNTEGFARAIYAGATIPSCSVITFEFAPTAGGGVLGYTADAPYNNWNFSDLNPTPGNPTDIVNLANGGDQIYFMQGGTWVMGIPGDHQGDYIGGRIIYGFNTKTAWNNLAGDSGDSELHPDVVPCFHMEPNSGTSNYFSYQALIDAQTPTSQIDWISRIGNSNNWQSYPDCASYTDPMQPFICTPSNMSISCNGLCSGCGTVTTTLTFNLPSGGGTYNVVYTDGTNNFTIPFPISDGHTEMVTVTSTTTFSLVSVTDVNNCPIYSNFDGDATISVTGGGSANPAGPLTECGNGAGQATFDLSSLDATVSGGSGTVDWYTDMLATMMIVTPGSFTSGTTTVYATVTSAGCTTSPEAVSLNVTAPPMAVTPLTPLNVCDNGTGTGIFNLTTLNSTINGGTALTVNWAENNDGSNPIPNPATYSSSGGFVYAQVFDPFTTCGSNWVTTQLVLDPAPAVTPIAPQSECETGGGQATFDLTAFESTLNGGTAQTVNWAENNDGSSPILNTTNYSTTTATIYAQVVGANSCTSAWTPVSLIVNTAPGITPILPIEACDNGAGIASFNLSSFNSSLNGTPGVDVNWAQNSDGSSPIFLPGNFVSGSTTVYAQVFNTTTTCASAWIPVTLNVLAPPLIFTSNINCTGPNTYTVDVTIFGVAGSTYNLSGTAITGGNPTTANEGVLFTLTLNTLSPLYTLIITDAANSLCGNNTSISSPGCACPTGNLSNSAFDFCTNDNSMDISLGGATGLTITNNSNLDVNDLDGDGVDWFTDFPPTTPYIPGNLSASTTCLASTQQLYAFMRCDLANDGFNNGVDDSYELVGSVTVNVYPDLSGLMGFVINDGSCNPSVATWNCSADNFTISNDYDFNGATPDLSTETGSGVITFTVTNPNVPVALENSVCGSYTFTANYFCIECPSSNDPNSNESICEGIPATLPNLNIDNPNGIPVQWFQNISDPSNPMDEYIAGTTISYPISGDGCSSEDLVLHAYILCDEDGDPMTPLTWVNLMINHTVTIYPDLSGLSGTIINDGSCNPSADTWDCSTSFVITNDYDSNGATPDLSAETGTGVITFTVTNPNVPVALENSVCGSYTFTANYFCIECPSSNDPNSNESICEGIPATLPNLNIDNPNGNPVQWFQDISNPSNPTDEYIAGTNISYPTSGNGCSPEDVIFHAFILCDEDGDSNTPETWVNLMTNHTLTIYPVDISSFISNSGDLTCTTSLTVDPACGSLISISPSANQTAAAGTNGNHTYTISYDDGGLGCIADFNISVPYSCGCQDPAIIDNLTVSQNQICADETVDPEVMLSGGAVSGTWTVSPIGAGTFDDINSLNPVFDPSATGVITLTFTTNDPDGAATDCSSVSFSETVTVIDNDVATDPNIILCSADASSVDLTFYNASAGAGTISWYDGDPSASGVLLVPASSVDLNSVTDLWVQNDEGNGCPGSISVSTTINLTPSAPDVNSPLNYCQGSIPGPLSATGTDLLWYTAPSGGTGSATPPTPNVGSVGTSSYWVSQTINNCESDRAEIQVIVDPLPTIALSNINCVDANTYSVEVTISGIAGSTYTLSGSAISGTNPTSASEGNTFSLTLDNSNPDYTITVIDDANAQCSNSETISTPNCNCPSANLSNTNFDFCSDDANMDISLGGATGLTITSNANLDQNDSDGDGVDWFIDNPPTSPYIPGNLSATDMCAASSQQVFAFLRCDPASDGFNNSGDDSYAFAGSITINVFPDLSSLSGTVSDDGTCNPSADTWDCSGNFTITNDYDGNGATPDFSAETGTGIITFTVTNPNIPTSLAGSSCESYSFTANFFCVDCPNTSTGSSTESICAGMPATLPNLNLNNDNGNPVRWFQDIADPMNPSNEYTAGTAINYPANGNGCSPEDVIFHAFILCDVDGDSSTPDTWVNLMTTHTLTIYPVDISSFISTSGDLTCTTSLVVDPACGSLISISPSVGQTAAAGTNGNHSYTISYDDGGLGCIADFNISVPYSCGCQDPAIINNLTISQNQICVDETVDPEVMLSGGAVSGTWTVSPIGAGTFDDINSLNPVFDPSTIGVIILTFTTNDPDGAATDCSSVSLSESITVLNNDVAIDPNIILCSSDASSVDLTLYNASVGAGTISWYDGDPTATGVLLSPSSAVDLNSVTDLWVQNDEGNGCPGSISVTTTINSTPSAPGVNSPINYCQGSIPGPLSATGTDLLWYSTPSGGTGNMTPPTPNVGSVGTASYWVSQTINNCESDRAEIQVIVDPLPTITLSNINCVDANTYSVEVTITGVAGSTYTLSGSAISGANPTSASEGNTFSLTLDISNPDYSITVIDDANSQCSNSEMITTPNCDCPTANLTNTNFDFCSDDANMDISLGGATGLTITSNANLDQNDSDGDGVDWFIDNPPTSPYIPGNLSATDMCAASSQQVFAFLRCDPASDGFNNTGDDSYAFAGSITINVFPDLSSLSGTISDDGTCNPSADTWDCSGNFTITNDYDGNGATPDFSAETGTGIITFTVTNPNIPTSLSGSSCESYSFTANFFCVDCPNTNTGSSTESICAGMTATLPNLNLNNDNGNPVRWFQDISDPSNPTDEYIAGTNISYPTSGNGCSPEDVIFYAFILCDVDGDSSTPETWVNLMTNHTLTVYPVDISSFISTSGDLTCTTSLVVDPACGSLISISPSTSQAAVAGTNGMHAYTVSYDDSGLGCIADFDINVNYDCPSGCPDNVVANIDAANICDGESVSLSAMVSGGAASVTYEWTGDQGLGVISDPANLQLNNQDCAPITYVFTVTATCDDDNSLIGTAQTGVIVYPSDVSAFINTNGSGTCTTSISIDPNCGSWLSINGPSAQTGGTNPNGDHTYTLSYDYGNTVLNCIPDFDVTIPYSCDCQNPAEITSLTISETEICDGEIINTSVVLGGSATFGMWTTSPVGSGTFGDDTALNTTFTPATTGSILIIFTTNDPDGAATQCSPAIESTSLTVNAIPSAPVVASPITYCLGDMVSPLTATGSNLMWYDLPLGGIGTNISPTPNSATSGTTSYWVSQTINGCESERAEIQVDVLALPFAMATSAEQCDEGMSMATFNLTDLESTINGGLGNNVSWFEDMNGITSITDPTSFNSSATSVFAQVSDGACTSDFVEIVLTIGSQLVATDTNTEACDEGNGEATFNLSALENTVNGGLGFPVFWYDDVNAMNPISSTYTTTSTTVYAVVQDGNCTSNIATITLSVSNSVSANPAMLTACDEGNSEASFDLTSIESIVNNGTANPVSWFSDFSATMPIVSPHLSGDATIYAVVGSGNCASSVVTIDLIVNDIPDSAPALDNLCGDALGFATFDLTTLEATVNVGTSNTVNWFEDIDATLPIPSIYSTQSTVIYATVDNGECTSSTVAVGLTIDPAPTAIPTSANACDDGNGTATFDLSTLVSTINNGTANAVNFFEDITTLIPVPNNYTTATTTIFAVVGNGNCISQPVTVDLNITGAPTAIPTSADACDDGNGTATFDLSTLVATINDGTPNAVNFFEDITALIPVPNNYTTATTTIFAVVGDGTCSSQPVAIDLNVTNNPNANSAILNGCSDGSAFGNFELTDIENEVNGGTGNMVSWYEDIAASLPIMNTNLTSFSTTVFATVTLPGGCVSMPVPVSLIVLLPANDSYVDQLCADESVTINGTEYDIDNPSGIETFAGAATNGCDSTLSISLSFYDEVQGAITGSTTICGGQSAEITFNLSGANTYNVIYDDGVNPFVTLNGISDGHTISVSPSTTTEYALVTVEGINNPCASNIATNNVLITVTNISSAANVLSDFQGFGVSCNGSDDGAVEAIPLSGTAPFNYLWNTGETQATLENLSGGNYTVTITDNEGCTTESSVQINEPPVIISNLESIAPDCFGDNNGVIRIDTIIGVAAPFEYSLDGEFFNSITSFPYSISSLSAGNYNLMIQDLNDCAVTEVVNIQAPTEAMVNLGNDQTIQLGDSIQLDAIINLEVDTVIWGQSEIDCGGCLDPFVTPLQTSNYSITVMDSLGCTATDDIIVFVQKDRNVYIPSAFSPNGDGTNDRFFVNADQSVVNVSKFRIFNRWGETIFIRDGISPNDPLVGWDGYFKGQKLNPGVFVYLIEVTFIDGRVEMYKGDVTLMK